MKKSISFLLLVLVANNLLAQTLNAKRDSVMVKEIYSQSLTNGKSYEWLDYLSNHIGGRLSGSENAAKAIEYTKRELEALGLDKVWLQPVMVPKWTRGEAETAYFTSENSKTDVVITALGGSIATGSNGLKARVIEVKGLEELSRLGREKIKGKIIFYNRPMEDDLIHTFRAYGGCVDQRYKGALEAAKFGAVGVIVRSVSHKIDKFPHTGSMTYGDLKENEKIPAAAISTMDAEILSKVLQEDPNLEFFLKMDCKNHPDVQSYNVIGEITGSKFPNEIIVVGGHLDSWDIGDGSHDDGAGVVQSMEVLRLFKEAGLKPQRTLRVVLFMNEENGLRGGNKYAQEAKANNEKHVFALESDAGGFTPRGFSFDCSDAQFQEIQKWKKLFEPYLIHYFAKGGSGADINPLKGNGLVLAGLRPDSQRYFDYHHAASDTFDKVNKRELELGAATMASLVYLVDTHGFGALPKQEKLKN